MYFNKNLNILFFQKSSSPTSKFRSLKIIIEVGSSIIKVTYSICGNVSTKFGTVVQPWRKKAKNADFNLCYLFIYFGVFDGGAIAKVRQKLHVTLDFGGNSCHKNCWFLRLARGEIYNKMTKNNNLTIPRSNGSTFHLGYLKNVQYQSR